MKIRAIGSNILATMLEKGERTSAGGIVILDDEGKESGIRPRWCQVYDIGYDSDFRNDINPGDWILVAQGRWTDGVEVDGKTVWKIDPNGVLLCSEERPDGI
jgi:co-chaperonin GroES (HSP10)|tara:strand:- start:113 stop:418 length:306 start_codon:yes stop_codon:yes gene_type:complete